MIFLKFMYRTFFRAAVHRYLDGKNSSHHPCLDNSFSYAYFTPPWLSECIHCNHNDIFIDITRIVLPDLQTLRHVSIAANISLLLAAFKQKEPSFSQKAIDYLLTTYSKMPSYFALFRRAWKSRRLDSSQQLGRLHKCVRSVQIRNTNTYPKIPRLTSTPPRQHPTEDPAQPSSSSQVNGATTSKEVTFMDFKKGLPQDPPSDPTH